MAIPLLTAPGPAPSTNDPSTFDVRADAHIAWQATNVAEMNVVLPQIDNASQVAADAIIAVGAVEATLNTTKWAAGESYNEGERAWSPIDFLTYRRKVSGVSNTDPSLDQAGWALVVDNRPSWSSTTSDIAADHYLDAGGANVLNFHPTVADLSVHLPAATDVKLGPVAYMISNAGTYGLAVRDSEGALICYVRGGGYGVIALVENSTASGVWRPSGYGIDFIRPVAENWATGLAGAGLGRGGRIILKMTETVVVVIGRTGTTLQLLAVDLSTMQKGAIVNVASWPGSDTSPAVFAIGSTGGAVFTSAGGGTTCYGVAFTLSGLAITAGTVTSTTFAGNQPLEASSYGIGFQQSVAQIGGASGNQFFLPGATTASPFNFAPRVATVTGTSIAYGTQTQLGATEASQAIQSVASFAVGANQILAILKAGTSGYAARLLTVSGTGGTAAISETATSGWGGQSVITSVGSTQVTGFLRMSDSEIWLLATYNTSNYIMRVTFTSNSVAKVDRHVFTTSGQSDGNLWASHNLCLQHGLFKKIDASAAWVTGITNTGPAQYRVSWNADTSAFVASGVGTPLTAQQAGAMVNKPVYCAGDEVNAGVYVQPFNGNSVASGNGTVDACAAVYTWNNGSPRLTGLVKGLAVPATNTPGYTDFDCFYRNGKAYFFNTGTASGAHQEGIAIDTRTGLTLSRQVVRRNGGEYYRNVISANDGAYMVAVENAAQYLTVYEVAK